MPHAAYWHDSNIVLTCFQQRVAHHATEWRGAGSASVTRVHAGSNDVDAGNIRLSQAVRNAFPARKLDTMSIDLWRSRPYAHYLHHLVVGLYEQAFTPVTSGNPSDGGSTGFQSLPANVWETDDA